MDNNQRSELTTCAVCRGIRIPKPQPSGQQIADFGNIWQRNSCDCERCCHHLVDYHKREVHHRRRESSANFEHVALLHARASVDDSARPGACLSPSDRMGSFWRRSV